jgi:hypothetical protein
MAGRRLVRVTLEALVEVDSDAEYTNPDCWNVGLDVDVWGGADGVGAVHSVAVLEVQDRREVPLGKYEVCSDCAFVIGDLLPEAGAGDAGFVAGQWVVEFEGDPRFVVGEDCERCGSSVGGDRFTAERIG